MINILIRKGSLRLRLTRDGRCDRWVPIFSALASYEAYATYAYVDATILESGGVLHTVLR